VKQEDIPYEKWINTKFGKVYKKWVMLTLS
jgi:hypothetical protein